MQKDNKLKTKALKAGTWYSISNILLRAVSIVTAPIFTRLLTTTDYGVVSNFSSWQNILVIFCGLGLSYSIGRAKIDFENNFDEYISSIQGLSSLFSVILLALVIPFSTQIANFMELDRSIVLSLFVLMIFFPSIEYMQTKLRFQYRYIENIIIAVLNTVSTVSISIFLILVCDSNNKYFGRIYGMIIPYFFIALFCYFALIKKGKKVQDRVYWKYALTFSLPMIPHALAMVVLGQIDRIMIVKLCGNDFAGIYSFGYSYAIILSVITNAIMNAWQPFLYDCLKQNKHEDILQSNKLLNELSLIMTIGFIGIAPEIIMLLGSKDYWGAKWMVAPVAVGTLYQFYYSYFVYIEMYKKKTSIIAIGSVGAAVINMILNYIFIPRLGYLAAAYTTMAGYLFLMIYHWISYRVLYRRSIFAEKQILVFSILIPFIGVMFTFLYTHIFIRYVLLVAILSIYLVKNKQYVGEILKRNITKIYNKKRNKLYDKK